MSPGREGLHTVNPYLVVNGAAGQIEFLERVFDAKEAFRHANPDGPIMHAEVRIGDSIVMIGDANQNAKARPATCYLYVDDVDAIYRRGIEAGARSLSEPEDKPYGERNAGFEDPWGNYWWVGRPI
jgi:PhnB protein